MQSLSPSATFAERFAFVLGVLMETIGARMRRSPALAVIGWPVCRRIIRARNIVTMLMAKLLDGTLRQWCGLRAVAPREMDAANRQRLAGRVRGGVALPRQAGWLLPMVPCEAANLAGQLAVLLQDPQMRRLLAASPRVGRMLRPMCRMLGIDERLLVVAPEGEARRIGFFDPPAPAEQQSAGETVSNPILDPA